MNNINQELLACFDETVQPLPLQPRSEIHKEPLKIWHAVTNIWVINKNGKILCTKRSKKNEGNPGKWQTYVVGHVKADNTFLETAQRELTEELGLTGKLIHIKDVKYEPAKHITALFILIWNGKADEIKPVDGEIEDARWLSYEDYIREKTMQPMEWCNGLEKEIYDEMISIYKYEK